MSLFDKLPPIVHPIEHIYVHADCPDGLASAMILSHIWPDASVTFVVHNSREHGFGTAHPHSIWCDIAPHEGNAAQWRDAGAIVLDHHVSAREVVESFGDRGVYADIKAHPGVSGAVLAAKLYERELPNDPANAVVGFARIVGIGDTWQTHDPNFTFSRQQAAALMLYGPKHLVTPSHPPYLLGHELEAGQVVYDQQMSQVRKILDEVSVGHYTFGGWGINAIVFNDSTSALVNDVAEQAKSIAFKADFAASFHYRKDRSLKWSLRSIRSDFDVLPIAVAGGGGGHARAAAFAIGVTSLDNVNPWDTLYWVLDRWYNNQKK